MRTSHRLAWLSIADGALAGVLLWRWAHGDGPYQRIDAATVLTLVLGFLGAAPTALRSLRDSRQADTVQDIERRDALLLFPAEGSEAAGTPAAPPPSPGQRPPLLAVLAYGSLMITLMWRWAVIGEPYTALGAVTLSTLMLGFLRDAVLAVERLASIGQPLISAGKNEQQDALLLFPAEDSGARDLALTPRMLATGRKALL